MAILTDMRQSVWNAIDEWPALASTFQQKYRYEDDQGAMVAPPVPTADELPAISLYPSGPSSTPWELEQSQLLTYRLDCMMWSAHWNLLDGEGIWEEIVKALHQSAPNGGVPYVKSACNYYPVIGDLTISPGQLGREKGPAVTIWRFQIALMRNWNPALEE